jgi:hypothetical protein
LRRIRFNDPETGKTLMIKQFFGASENAVKTQIWIAVSVYVLVAIVRKKPNLDVSLYTLLQVLSLTLFEKMPLQQAFPGDEYTSDNDRIGNQLNLFRILPDSSDPLS